MKLSGNTVLVTGGSTGIGFDVEASRRARKHRHHHRSRSGKTRSGQARGSGARNLPKRRRRSEGNRCALRRGDERFSHSQCSDQQRRDHARHRLQPGGARSSRSDAQDLYQSRRSGRMVQQFFRNSKSKNVRRSSTSRPASLSFRCRSRRSIAQRKRRCTRSPNRFACS